MENIEFFKNTKKIYFIGIGGISQSALALIMKKRGFEVCGSDTQESEITTKLEENNIKVNHKHSKKNIDNFTPNLIVFSGAIKDENVELMYARSKNILCLERSDFIEKLLPIYNHTVSISGTHGKTTTTSMIGEIFLNAKKKTTIHIGGESVNLNSNYFCGGDDFFITEACEYRKSFLKFPSEVGVVLNIEEDHPDCYKNLEEISSSFSQFASICKNVCVNCEYVNLLNDKKDVISFGIKDKNSNDKKVNYLAKNVSKISSGGYRFKVYKNDEFFLNVRLNIFGKHNIYNALASICVADLFDIDKNIIKKSLSEFKGVKRRFEKFDSKVIPSTIYFDYAHHPTEIKNLIDETKILNKPIICVFQPHTYSRTKKYFNDFLLCFKDAYQTVFYKTYSAREKKIVGGSAKDLYKKLKGKRNVYYYNNLRKIIKHLKKYAKSNCLVLFVGAGDIYNIKKYL